MQIDKTKRKIESLWDSNHSLFKLKNKKNIKYGSVREISSLYHFYKFAWSKFNHSVKSVLDIGCGSGTQLCLLLDKKIVKKGVGVDISRNAIEICEKYLNYCNYSKNCSVFQKDFMVFSSKIKFEMVIAIQIINYMNLTTFFKKTDTLIKKNGYLIISDGQNNINTTTSLLDKIKANPKVRKFFKKKIKLSVPKEKSLIKTKNLNEIIKKSRKFSYNVEYCLFRNMFLTRILEKICFRISKKDFNSQITRNIMGLIYKFFVILIHSENKLLSKQNNLKSQYFLVLKKNN